jgi:hypothetical protein
MSDLTRIFTSVLGIAIGAGVGGGLYYLLFRYYEKLAGQPTLALLSALVLIGGGILGGGYLALILTTKFQKARRAKRRSRADRGKYQPKKKAKK